MPGFNNPDKPNENWNRSLHEKQVIECAGMDFAGIPIGEMLHHFNVVRATILSWRATELYQETMAQWQADFAKDLYTAAGTTEMRKKIAKGMHVSVHRLIEIVSGQKSRVGDVINAARLLAQLDGRFLKASATDGEVYEGANDPLAAELILALQSVKKDQEDRKDTVQ